MSTDTRINGDIQAIDYEATRRFFERRAAKADTVDRLSVTMYQDDRPDLVRERDVFERDTVLPHLALEGRPHVLDVGCGTGRWGLHLAGHVSSYLGIDFSRGLVALATPSIAEAYPEGNGAVRTGSATELLAAVKVDEAPFELVIVAGLLAYLNDEDCIRCLRQVETLAADDATIYLREPIALDDRLTLRSHYSDELADSYSAVYRPLEFYADLLRSQFPAYQPVISAPLSPELRNRSETSQHLFVLKGRP